ncbi:MAG: endolytic transglycosylase MltG [bacterium]|nr:MAG: endolytic transglycosylase MltG [bacterium]
MIIGKRERKRRVLPLLLLAVLLAAGLAAARLWIFWYTPSREPGSEVMVTIPGGSSFVSASRLLLESGVITSLKPFVFIGKIKGLSNSIQAGELMFRTDMSPAQVMVVLTRGKPVSYQVTVPEGYDIRQIAGLLSSLGLVDGERFLKLSTDADFSRSLGVPAGSLEGFLFPDTYHWPKGLTEEDILARMVSRYAEVLTPEMRQRMQEMGLSELEVVTLASIIEKETGAPEERNLVSAVFHNRLRKGYRLQTDPTVIYGLEEFDGNLTREHLRQDHPYNTYTRPGLPPGPIANPGEASLLAALNPAEVNYLYFVSRGDGTHVFSSTLVEHNEAVRAFQLGGGR